MSEVKEKTRVSQRMQARVAMLKAAITSDRVTDLQKTTIIALLEHGATMAEIERVEGMPSSVTIWREGKHDRVFADALVQARAIGAANIIDEAQDELRRALETGDPDTMRVAHDYVKGSTSYAEKIAPREFGPLVKHAGADGGAMVVQTIQYSQAEARSLEVESEVVARVPITASKATD